jgi:hypothetical protein
LVAFSTPVAVPAIAGTAVPVREPDRQTLQALVERHSATAFELYRDLLTLPNVATKPDDILKVIEWLEREFGKRGFTTERLDRCGDATRA